MKRFARFALFALLSVCLLTVTAFADFGPKPQLTVKVRSAPAGPYYLDLLAEGEYEGHTYGSGESEYSGIDWSYSAEEAAALDQALLDTLRDAVPEGWHACTAEGGSGPPMWGDLAGENGIHTFRYVGVPTTYRVILVTAEGETWVSGTLNRQALQSSVTVDWAAKTAKAPPLAVGYVLQFSATFFPTLLIEGLLLVLFRLHRERRNWLLFILVNLVTQGVLTGALTNQVLRHGAMLWYLLPFALLEVLIALLEGWFYGKHLISPSRKRAVAYGVTANAVSALVGLGLAEPVWRFVVTIS